VLCRKAVAVTGGLPSINARSPSTGAEQKTAEQKFSQKEKNSYESNMRTASTLPISIVSLFALVRERVDFSEEADKILSVLSLSTILTCCVSVGMFIASYTEPYRSVCMCIEYVRLGLGG
jgi:hypothetical protein